MKVVRKLKDIIKPESGAAATVGFFDGAHLGHRKIISRVVAEAKAAGLSSELVTFSAHPMSVVAPDRAPSLITTASEKLEILESLGVDTVVMLEFDESLRGMTADEFTRRILVDALGTKVFVAGYDTKFGMGGKGDAEFLSAVAPELGFRLVEIPAVTYMGIIVSSTAVRNALSAGDVEMAARMLDKRYSVRGEVVRGLGNGAKLGFRTANIAPPPEKLIPRIGIYAAWCRFEGEKYKAAVNIGLNPTLRQDLKNPSVEAYLIDFSGDLYGKTLECEFVKYIRSEKKFSKIDELIERIQIDVSIAQEVLK